MGVNCFAGETGTNRLEQKINELEKIIAKKDIEIRQLKNQLNSVNNNQPMNKIANYDINKNKTPFRIKKKKPEEIEIIITLISLKNKSINPYSLTEKFFKNVKAYKLIQRLNLREKNTGINLKQIALLKMKFNGKEISPGKKLDEIGINNNSIVELYYCKMEEYNGEQILYVDEENDEKSEEEYIEIKYKTLIFNKNNTKRNIVLEENAPVCSAFVIYLYLENLDYLISDLYNGLGELYFTYENQKIPINDKRTLSQVFKDNYPQVIVNESNVMGG